MKKPALVMAPVFCFAQKRSGKRKLNSLLLQSVKSYDLYFFSSIWAPYQEIFIKIFTTSYDPKMKHRIKVNESQWAAEIAIIMQGRSGPFTRQFLAKELEKKFPFPRNAASLEVSGVLISDAYVSNSRFKRVKGGWDLIGRPS